MPSRAVTQERKGDSTIRAEVGQNCRAPKESETGAKVDPHRENAHCHAETLSWKDVGENRKCGGCERRFTDGNSNPASKKSAEAGYKPAGTGREAPQKDLPRQ